MIIHSRSLAGAAHGVQLRYLAALLALPCAAPAPAQISSNKVEEVVVTANRVGVENVQDIPMSISVIDTGTLNRQGLNSLSDFENTIPSLSVQEYGPGQNSIAIRGISDPNGIDSTNLEDQALVSVYLDDTPISLQSATPDLKVFDLERIEVIRGPQGTLYGASAMAGTVRFISRKPDTDSFFGHAEALYSQTYTGGGDYSARAMLNIPLSAGKAGATLSAYNGSDAGYIDNIGYGQQDANSVDTTQARAALRFLPSDKLTLDFSVTHSDIEAKGNNTAYADLGNGHDQFSTLTPEGLRDRLTLSNFTAAYDLGFADLTSSTSYATRRLENDQSFEIPAYLYIFGYRTASPDFIVNDIDDFTEELRLNSHDTGRFKWITGVYYENFHRDYEQNDLTPGLDDFLGIPSTDLGAPVADDLFYGLEHLKQRQLAAFGEATWSFTSKLDFTAGVRYFDYKQTYSNLFGGIAGALDVDTPLYQIGTGKATGFNPRLVLSYRFSDATMLFAEAGKGFRLGGVNQPVPDSFCGPALAEQGLTEAPITFGPDKLYSYTLGEKSTIADGRATLNVSGFYVDWRSLQTNDYLNCGYYFAENAGRVTSKGLELETTARLSDNLTLTVNGSYTNAEAAEAIPNLGAVEGDAVPYFPKYIGNAFLSYELPLDGNSLFMQLGLQYRGSYFNSFEAASKLEAPSSSVVNASLSYMMGKWELGLYGRNLTDEHVVTSLTANTNGDAQPGDSYAYARPRSIGLRARFSF